MTEKVLGSTDLPKLAAKKRQNLLAWGLGTAGVGSVILCTGCLMLSNSTVVASTFLGATVVFGLPMTEADALRIHAAAFGSSMVLAFGALSVAVGIVLALRGRGAATASRQTDRV
ncbi:MAG: hypothetical protein V3T72_13690 [Thermoanaerobaculia bacterium]